MNLPPQPNGHPIIGHLMGFKNDPINFMMNSAAQHGDMVLFKLLNKKIYFLNNPEYVRHVMQNNHKNYVKSPGYKPLRLLGGMGIFTSDGEKWLRQRKLYQPAFSHKSIETYSKSVIQNTNDLLDDWNNQAEKGDTINISRDMMKVTMAIISETLFSTKIDYESDLWDSVSYALGWINDRALKNPFVLPANWPTPKNRKFHAAVDHLNSLVYKIIEEKQNNNANPGDLLSRFMNPGGDLEGLNAEELRDEVMTVFIAGHETSANVLMWVFYELCRHPEIEALIFEEVNSLGNRDLKYTDLYHLEYTAQVLNEVMRLYPPVWHMGRQNLAPDKIGAYEIPAGSHVRMSPLVLHRHPAYWENPNDFNPNRFSKENMDTQKPFSFIPFGAGPRLCAGRNFAMMEMVLILAKAVQRFKIESDENYFVEMGPLMTLRPKDDIAIKLARR
jgi:cytochrome P450